jgi:hypothetical protein
LQRRLMNESGAIDAFRSRVLAEFAAAFGTI